MGQLKRFWKDEQGLETVEYAIILGLIVVGTIVAIGAIGTLVANQFTTVQTTLEGEGIGSGGD